MGTGRGAFMTKEGTEGRPRGLGRMPLGEVMGGGTAVVEDVMEEVETRGLMGAGGSFEASGAFSMARESLRLTSCLMGRTRSLTAVSSSSLSSFPFDCCRSRPGMTLDESRGCEEGDVVFFFTSSLSSFCSSPPPALDPENVFDGDRPKTLGIDDDKEDETEEEEEGEGGRGAGVER